MFYIIILTLIDLSLLYYLTEAQTLSTMATARALKIADQRTKDVVAGYCKDVQTILTSENPNNSFYIIPTQIRNICLAYYFVMEQFIECGNKYIRFTNERRTIYNPLVTGSWDTAYGTFEIDCNEEINKNVIFAWTFDIEDNGDDCNAIGIDETKRKWVNNYFKIKAGTVNYAYIADGTAYASAVGLSPGINGYVHYGKGDMILMELNMKNKTLIYYKYKRSEVIDENKKANAIARKFENVNTENVTYCLAVYLWKSGYITLTDFQIREA